MKASKFSEAQIAFVLKQAEDGSAVAEVCRKAGISQAADSDQFARLFRSHLAQDSEMISPRVPISNRPGTRFFQHVSFWHR